MADEKKHKSGFALLKEKLAKAEAKINELEKQLNVEVAEHQALEDKYEKLREELIRTTQDGHKQYNEQQDTVRGFSKKIDELQTTIDQQSRKISQLTADLHSSETLRLNADAAHSKKEGEMLRAMGPIRRWWWNVHHLPTFKEDERWNETH